MSAILREKTFPSQYPADAVKVLKTMSFSNGKNIQIVGSQSLRSQLYAGDYDIYEVVEGRFPTRQGALQHYVKGFQNIIRNLQKMPNVHIGDIKSGIIEEWRIIPKKGAYKFHPTREKIESLFQTKIISADEAKLALSSITLRPKKVDVLKARDDIKFHIVRWTPSDILKGHLTLRDGRKYTLEEAFGSPTITKLDIVALIQDKYTELSIIYEFHNGKEVLNPDVIDPESSLKDAILLYQHKGNLFKVIKRKFALAKLQHDIPKLKKYNTILNSELGKLYVVYSDVKTLVELIEDTTIPSKRLKEAIQGFQYRLSRIYSLEDYLKSETAILAKLDSALNSKNPLPTLKEVEDALLHHLTKATRLYGGELRH
jgi:hypothetical protein